MPTTKLPEFQRALPDLPAIGSLLRADAADQETHWGVVDVEGRARPEAGLLSRATYFGAPFLCVDVPNMDMDSDAPAELLSELSAKASGKGMTRRLLPFDKVNCITLTGEEEARTEAAVLAIGDMVRDEEKTRQVEKAVSGDVRAARMFGGKLDEKNVAPGDGELGDMHGQEVCPHPKGHLWARVWSAPKDYGDLSPPHPAETKNLAVWFECAFCDTWAEVEDGEESC